MEGDIFMKTILFTLIALTMMFGSLLAQDDYSSLDNKKGTSMEPILARAEPLVKRIENKGNEIVRMEYDLVFSTKSTTRTLYKGWTYGIVAFGDCRIKDIDIAVYKQSRGEWKLVEKDAENDHEASVTIKPYRDEEYKIDITVYKFTGSYTAGHYGLLIFHE